MNLNNEHERIGAHSKTARVLLLLALPSHVFFVLIVYFIDRDRWTLFTVPFVGMYLFAVFAQVRFSPHLQILSPFSFREQYCT